jgi:L,D-peptidoglycan transpeptidase YkuD (ErfK/YbiS/YcfS/YnhG family)
MKKLPLYVFILTALVLLFALASRAQPAHKHGRKTAQSLAGKQLMVVITNGWDNLQGRLYAFNKYHNKWVLQFSNAVVVGSKGLGVGDGVIPFKIKDAPVKKEGDKKSPAGIFTIGTAFGYADKKDAAWIKNPYIRAFDTLICVDDMHSSNYNRLVDKDSAKTDHNSFEYMHRKDDYYKWGLFINHNSGKVVAGDGSCIFMHIWKNDHEGTDGCTAMKEANILRVLRWIKAEDKPVLVQMPATEYRRLSEKYGLPGPRF